MNPGFLRRALCFASILALFLLSYGLLLVLIPSLGGGSFFVALLLLIPFIDILSLACFMPLLRRMGFNPSRMVALAVTAYMVILAFISLLGSTHSNYGFLRLLIAFVMLLLQIFPSYLTALLYYIVSKRKARQSEDFGLQETPLASAD